MSELTFFVRDALQTGKSRQEVRQALRSAGWPQDEVADALDEFAEVDFPVPVPRRKPTLSARDAFLHLVAFLALYISAIGLGTLLFELINLWLPDPVREYATGRVAVLSSLRWAAASVIVSFPVYLGMSRLLLQGYRDHPKRRISPIRRWLTYLTLFVAAAVVISYLIALLADVLGGELALPFALKVGVVAAITGTIFTYYLTSLRREETEG